MKLVYFSKDGTFHEKVYAEHDQCKHDYNILKRANVPFFYANGGCGFYDVMPFGLWHGKETKMENIPAAIADKFKEIIGEDNSRDYGGKRELWWDIHESEFWFSLRLDLGEDAFENEEVHNYFITKDGKHLCEC